MLLKSGLIITSALQSSQGLDSATQRSLGQSRAGQRRREPPKLVSLCSLSATLSLEASSLAHSRRSEQLQTQQTLTQALLLRRPKSLTTGIHFVTISKVNSKKQILPSFIRCRPTWCSWWASLEVVPGCHREPAACGAVFGTS